MRARLPENEAQRLQILREYRVLDTTAEQAFDDLTRLASLICGTPIALVSLVDSDRQWFKARVGLDATQTPREHAFCAHAILNPSELMVVADAKQDERFAANPLVTGDPGVRFYAGAPLVTPTGEALGTLCVIDRSPRQLDSNQAEILRALSRQVIAVLEMARGIIVLEEALASHEAHLARVEDYQRKLEDANAQLGVDNTTDALTGAFNRRAFDRRLEEEFARASRHGTALSLALLDVDRFKAYNDDYGHPAGDEVLRRVAAILRETTRSYDLVARYGGEEFALLLPATDRDGALVIAERCRRALQRAPWPQRGITASVGTATATSQHKMAADLLAAADDALYRSKQSGRNRVTSG